MSYAIKFTGTNHLEELFNTSTPIDFTQFSIKCWVNTDHSGPLFYHKDTEKHTYFYAQITEQGALLVQFKSKQKAYEFTSFEQHINNGQWVHLSFVVDQSQVSIAVNDKVIKGTTTSLDQLLEEEIKGLVVGKSTPSTAPHFFQGELSGITVWNKPLSQNERSSFFTPSDQDKNDNLMAQLPFLEEDHDSVTLHAANDYIPLPPQEVTLTLLNNSEYNFEKQVESIGTQNLHLPQTIPANQSIEVKLIGNYGSHGFQLKAFYLAKENKEINLTIEVKKSLVYYESHILVTTSDTLQNDVNTSKLNQHFMDAHITISENLVIVTARNVNRFIEEVSKTIEPQYLITNMDYNAELGIAVSSTEKIIRYNQEAQVFNRRIQEKPFAIVQCGSTQEVALVYTTAKKFNLPISVRSGGHDHEGECTGTNTILIDLIRLNTVEVDHKSLIATIGPGNRFIRLTTALANEGVMIPHGTCATVAIPGFVMGGGWGPWTRSKGMCCERIVEATLVLGNGQIETVSENHLPDLLWALRGGGGMSYGIVTEFKIQTFRLPTELIKFELEWNPYDNDQNLKEVKTPHATLDVLKAWEAVIESTQTEQLIGTNLKINGKNRARIGYDDNDQPIYESIDTNTVKHNCLMYGYWNGDQVSLNQFVQRFFTDKNVKPNEERIDGIGGLGTNYGDQLMGAWDRESFYNVQRMSNGLEGKPLPPDLDQPAPHKITSRLVEPQGLGESGYSALINSLTSPLILPTNRQKGLFNYVTLGAIVGKFYKEQKEEQAQLSAFPYPNMLYTIQYQTWWNNELEQKDLLQNNKVYTATNRALDWMEVARDYDIPNTSGAFISFKDNSIPTKTYFAQNYDALISVKENYSEDPYNHFRKRKTII